MTARREAPRRYLLHLRQLLRDIQVRAAQRLHLPLAIVTVHLQRGESHRVKHAARPVVTKHEGHGKSHLAPFPGPEQFRGCMHVLSAIQRSKP